MRIEKLHRLYIQELKTIYGWKKQSPTPVGTRADRSFDAYLIETEQARRLDRIFEWLGHQPVLQYLRTQEER